MSDLEYALADLVSAYHILHYHEVFQEYGSISVRNPENPDTFFTGCLPAILVASREHLNQFKVRDGELLYPDQVRAAIGDLSASTAEPFVHSCIYDRFPRVQSIVHSQSVSGIVYSLCDAGGSMIMPIYNKAGFVGTYNPIFNPAKYYTSLPDTHSRDLRVSHKMLGDKMAALSHDSNLDNGARRDAPDYSCVLLRGNGVAVWDDSIPGAVHKAIHLDRGTTIQTAAMLQRAHSDLDLTYLDKREAIDAEETVSKALRLMWAAWKAEVQGQPKYRNAITLDKKLVG